MKKILLVALLGGMVPLFAADDKLNDFRPEAVKGAVAPTGVEWQNANNDKLAAETSDCALAAVVACDKCAEELLAKLKGAYCTDALVATKIAAVTQYVMIDADAAWYEFWRASRSEERDLWCKQLLAAAKRTDDSYVKQFCFDQLRWCGKASHCQEIKEIAEKSGKKEVKDLADIVVRELENADSAF